MFPVLLRIMLAVLLIFQIPSGVFAKAPEEQIVAFTFDWDDNIFEMPTKIMLFNRNTGEQFPLSTAEYALARSKVGKPGTEFADFEVRDSLATGSMRFFGDIGQNGAEQFQKDIDFAILNHPGIWKGPVWNDFSTAMRRSRTAANTWIITARMHGPETIHRALLNLRNRGFLGNVPPVENIWPVNAPGFEDRFRKTFGVEPPAGSAANPSARKAGVMEQILDRIERTPFPRGAKKVLAPVGKSRQVLHLWGFSDDDYGNFEKAVQVLQKGVDSRRWRRVKLTVFFTGKNSPGKTPHAVTLVPGKSPRPFSEGNEWKNLVDEVPPRIIQK